MEELMELKEIRVGRTDFGTDGCGERRWGRL